MHKAGFQQTTDLSAGPKGGHLGSLLPALIKPGLDQGEGLKAVVIGNGEML
jgi:hypothetical protein